MKIKRSVIGYGITITAALASFLYWQNRGIVVNRIDYQNDKLPKSYQGYRILQVSDLHNTLFGEKQKRLIKYTKEIAPDMITITGDLIDCHRTDLEVAMAYVREAVKIAPVYYVSGNHEGWTGDYNKIRDQLIEAGVYVLDDQSIILEKEEDKIRIIGLRDKIIPDTEQQLEELTSMEDHLFTMLLSHRPEYIHTYAKFPVDLVFSGHAHGGQIRMPFIGGLYAPGQGLLPKITNSMHKVDNTSMIVSRGLGNSVFPFRLFNRPELVVVTLKK